MIRDPMFHFKFLKTAGATSGPQVSRKPSRLALSASFGQIFSITC